MRDSIFDTIGNLDTLLAVVVGAVLATTGALVAELVQDRLNRARAERDAARFFGEIMSSTDKILNRAIASREIGEPWGPVTRRLFRMALREAAIYERNRERLFNIRDAELRARINTHMLTKTFPIDSIVDNSDALVSVSDALLMDEPDDARRTALTARANELSDALDAAFEAVRDEMSTTPALCEDLARIGQVDFRQSPNPTAQAPRADG